MLTMLGAVGAQAAERGMEILVLAPTAVSGMALHARVLIAGFKLTEHLVDA